MVTVRGVKPAEQITHLNTSSYCSCPLKDIILYSLGAHSDPLMTRSLHVLTFKECSPQLLLSIFISLICFAALCPYFFSYIVMYPLVQCRAGPATCWRPERRMLSELLSVLDNPSVHLHRVWSADLCPITHYITHRTDDDWKWPVFESFLVFLSPFFVL